MKTPLTTLRTANKNLVKIAGAVRLGESTDRAALDRAMERVYKAARAFCSLDAEFAEAQAVITAAEAARFAAIQASEAIRSDRLRARADMFGARTVARDQYAKELAVYGCGV